jgi:phosphatidate cytidylyltransferase
MLWPWIEQVSERVYESAELLRQQTATATAAAHDPRIATLQAMESSVWYTLSQWFRTVKPHYLVPTILTASLVAAFALHSRRQRVEGAMANAGGTLLTIVYLGVLPGFFLPICMTHNAWMMLAIIGVVKAADIGAYITGHAIGRHKLIPWLSPGKTREGFVGGLVLAGAAGAVLAVCFKGFTWPQGLVAGLLLGAVGQLGDLLESLLKRDAGVKDSGRVPGFGGILDILDSPLLAAPVAYWLLKLVTKS